jgi:heme-degrading monooxygenase HmoA
VILEAAMLQVRSGAEAAFEAAFRQASPLIAASPGYRGHELHRCLETPVRYLLRVTWERLEDHTVGFRGSPRYAEWKALLHGFYDPFPTVEHFRKVPFDLPTDGNG